MDYRLRGQIPNIWKMRNLSIWLLDPFQIWPMNSVYSAIKGFWLGDSIGSVTHRKWCSSQKKIFGDSFQNMNLFELRSIIIGLIQNFEQLKNLSPLLILRFYRFICSQKLVVANFFLTSDTLLPPRKQYNYNLRTLLMCL